VYLNDEQSTSKLMSSSLGCLIVPSIQRTLIVLYLRLSPRYEWTIYKSMLGDFPSAIYALSKYGSLLGLSKSLVYGLSGSFIVCTSDADNGPAIALISNVAKRLKVVFAIDLEGAIA